MKKIIYSITAMAALAFTSCGGSGYSEEAGKAADSFCSCAKELDLEGMKDNPGAAMEFLSCMEEPMKYAGEDKAKSEELEKAIKDKCPDVYDAMENMK